MNSVERRMMRRGANLHNKENLLNGNESEPRSVADPNPPPDDTDIYAVLAKEYRIDQSTVSILRTKRVFERLSVQEIRVMMERYIATFGTDIAQRLISYAPKDVRPWLEEVAPRVSELGRVCPDLKLRFAFDMIIREYEMIQCPKDHFDALIESLFGLISSPQERQNFLYAYPQYFSLDPVKVRAFTGRGFSLKKDGDVPAFWQQLKSFSQYTKDELETARKAYEKTLETQLRRQSEAAPQHGPVIHSSPPALTNRASSQGHRSSARLNAPARSTVQLKFDDMLPGHAPVFMTRRPEAGKSQRSRPPLPQEAPSGETQLALFDRPMRGTYAPEVLEHIAEEASPERKTSTYEPLIIDAPEADAAAAQALAAPNQETVAIRQAEQYLYALRLSPGMRNKALLRLRRVFGSVRLGMAWIGRMRTLGWTDEHFLRLFQSPSCRALRVPSEMYILWMALFRDKAGIDADMAARILIDNDFLLTIGVQECEKRLEAACDGGAADEKRNILVNSTGTLRMRAVTLRIQLRKKQTARESASGDSLKKPEEHKPNDAGADELRSASRTRAPSLSRPEDAFLSNGWKRPAVEAHFRAFPSLSRQPANILYESIRLLAHHLGLRGSPFTHALSQGIASVVEYAPRLNELDRRNAADRRKNHAWYAGFGTEGMAQELAVSVHRLAEARQEEEIRESSNPLTDALNELDKWLATRRCDEQAEDGTAYNEPPEARNTVTGKTFLMRHPHMLALHRQPLLVIYGMIRSYGLREYHAKTNLLQKPPQLHKHLAPLFLHPQVLMEIINRQRKLAVESLSDSPLDSATLDPCLDWRRLLTPLPELEWRYALLRQERARLKPNDPATAQVIEALFGPSRKMFATISSRFARAW